SQDNEPPNARDAAAPRPYAATPAAAHVSRYPAANTYGATDERSRVSRAYKATVGAADGNIIAAIITSQTPMNQPKPPSPVHGPLSMPRISRAVHTQPAAARTNSDATRPSRARAAVSAGLRPVLAARSRSRTVIGSSGPGELRLRHSGLALVGD